MRSIYLSFQVSAYPFGPVPASGTTKTVGDLSSSAAKKKASQNTDEDLLEVSRKERSA